MEEVSPEVRKEELAEVLCHICNQYVPAHEYNLAMGMCIYCMENHIVE